MHPRSWNRCLAQDPETGAWCRHRPTEGVFCTWHAREFREDEAAKAATRLARARLVLRDPSTTPARQWRAALQVRRALRLRRSLLGRATRSVPLDADVAFNPGSLVQNDDINTWR